MSVLYGRAGRWTAQNGGFRPGQKLQAKGHRVVLFSQFTSMLDILSAPARGVGAALQL
jgi:SNF2 family DNA or RNA helicase